MFLEHARQAVVHDPALALLAATGTLENNGAGLARKLCGVVGAIVAEDICVNELAGIVLLLDGADEL